MNEEDLYEGIGEDTDDNLNENPEQEATESPEIIPILIDVLGYAPLTNRLLEQVLPNNLIAVDGEESLDAKVAPYVKDAEAWLKAELLGDFEICMLMPHKEETAFLAVRAVLLKAVISAIPALDLVVTPTGFGVVSSSSIAPASKERVERLINSLSTALEGALCNLFDALEADYYWREKSLPSELCSTFFRLRDALQVKSDGDIFDRFRSLRDAGKQVINALESKFIGIRTMRVILRDFHDGPFGDISLLASPIRHESMRYFRALRQRPATVPDERDIWNAAQSVIERLPKFPYLYEEWLTEMGRSFDLKPFRNNRRGGYFF